MKRFSPLFLLMSLLLALWGVASAQPAPAGTQIENQAFATYTDSAGVETTVPSNTVLTVVQSVYDFVITPDGETPATPAPANTETVVAGETVSFAYTITNQGNATDAIALSVVQDAGDDFNFDNVLIYLDANGNGLVDPGETAITSVTGLTASGVNSSRQVVVVGTVPAGTATGAVGNLNLVGTGSPNGATANTDENNWAQANALSTPALTLDKTVTPTTGIVPGTTLSYSLSGSNTGGSSPFAVDNVVTLDGTPTDGILISDVLPAGLIYETGTLTGSYTSAGATAPGTAIYSTTGGTTWTAAEPTTGVNAVGFLIAFGTGARLNPTTAALTYTLDFEATVPLNASSTASYSNVGELSFDSNGDNDGADTGEAVETLPTVSEVDQVDAVAVGPDGFPNGDGTGTYSQANPTVPADSPLTVTRNADTQTIATVDNGRTATFQHSLANNGNIDDIYDLEATLPAGFPAGSAVFTDLAGTPITELAVAAGTVQDFLVIITIPEDYVTATPVDFTVTATSQNTPTLSDTSTDTLGSVTENDFADVTLGNSDGDDATAPSTTPVTQPGTAGAPVTFPLEITNGGNNPDTFNLTGSSSLPGTPTPTYYLDANCDGTPDGGPITTVGPLASGANVCILATVTVPAGTPAESYTVTSTATSQIDPTQTSSITNIVTVAIVEGFTFDEDLSQNTVPGAPTVYSHTVTNGSNTDAAVAFTLTEPGTPGWTYEYSLDGLTYSADITTLNTTVPAGQTQQVFVRVTPPVGADDADVDAFTITATPTYTVGGTPTVGTADTVTDTTTVQAGTLGLVKSVSPVGPAAPGDTLTYTIVGTNSGSAAITDVHVTDALPAFTNFVSVSATTTLTGTVLYSVDDAAWSPTPPTTLGAGGSIFVGVDTNGDTDITAADTFAAGGTVTVTFAVVIEDGTP